MKDTVARLWLILLYVVGTCLIAVGAFQFGKHGGWDPLAMWAAGTSLVHAASKWAEPYVSPHLLERRETL